MSGRIVSFTASKYTARAGEPITLTVVVENTTITAQNYRLIGKAVGSCVNQQGAMDISVARDSRREITININMHNCTHTQSVELWQSGRMLDSKSLTLTLEQTSSGTTGGTTGSSTGGTTGSSTGGSTTTPTYRVTNVSVSGHYLYLRKGDCYSFGPYGVRSKAEKDTYIFNNNSSVTVTFNVDGPTPFSWWGAVAGTDKQGFDVTSRTVSFTVNSYDKSGSVVIKVWQSGNAGTEVTYTSDFQVVWSRWTYQKIACEAEIKIHHQDEWGREVGGTAEIYQGGSLVGRNYAKVPAYSDVRIKILDNPGYVYVKTFMTIEDVGSPTYTSKEFTINVGLGVGGAVTWRPEQQPPSEYRAYMLTVKSNQGGSVLIIAGPDTFTVNENETKSVTTIGFVTLRAIPKTNYQFDKFTVDGQVIYSDTYAWTLTKNTTVNAYFKQSQTMGTGTTGTGTTGTGTTGTGTTGTGTTGTGTTGTGTTQAGQKGMIVDFRADKVVARVGEPVTLYITVRNFMPTAQTFTLVGRAYGQCVNESGRMTITLGANETKTYTVQFNMHNCNHTQLVELYDGMTLIDGKSITMTLATTQPPPTEQPPTSTDFLNRLMEILNQQFFGLPLWLWLVMLIVLLVLLR